MFWINNWKFALPWVVTPFDFAIDVFDLNFYKGFCKISSTIGNYPVYEDNSVTSERDFQVKIVSEF